jgi:hypothetical protein
MKYQNTFEHPTQAKIDRAIEFAHQLRSEYITRSIKSGFVSLRGLVLRKRKASSLTI